MKIHVHQISAEGEFLEGELEPAVLELPPNDLVRPEGPVTYRLSIGISEGGLFATGSLEMDFEATCVRCLGVFSLAVRIANFAIQEELAGAATFDLTPHLREDILLALPAHPHCDWDGSRGCPATTNILPSPTDGGQDESGAWEALDQLHVR